MLYGLSGIFSFAFVCFSFCEIDLEPKGRSRHHEVFCRKRVLKNFAKFTAKHLCQSIFFKKRDSDAGVFPVYFAKIQITHCLQSTSNVALVRDMIKDLNIYFFFKKKYGLYENKEKSGTDYFSFISYALTGY